MEILHKLVKLMERFRYIENRSGIVLVILAAIALVGVINCILGYRLLRFWMMLGGVAVGAALGYLVVDSMESASQNYYIFGSAGCGIVCGVICFFIYKVGIWAIGGVIGLVGSFYLLHPMAYSTLFVCLLIGTAFGILTLKFSRVVIILSTSILGGAMAGLAGVRIAALPDWPYGVLAAVCAAALGIVIQFAVNKEDEKAEETEISQ